MIKLFRILIVLSILFSILGSIVDTVFEQTHPEIENFLSHIGTNDIFSKMPDVVAMIIGLLFVIAYFVIKFALLLFKDWARDANLILSSVGFLIILILGFTILSPFATLFYDLALFIDGAILALSYFSPLKEKFKESVFSRILNRLH